MIWKSGVMAGVLWGIMLVGASTPAAESQPASGNRSHTFTLYAGSYTAGASKGIYAWRFDADSGALAPLGLMAETPQAAHIWISPNGKFLYTVNWEMEGGVSAFAIDPNSARLTFLNRVSSHGARPNQIVLDPSGRVAVTVNYASGSLAAYEVLSDGKLAEAFFVDQHS